MPYNTQMLRSVRGPRKVPGVSSGMGTALPPGAGERVPDETKENMKL